MSTVTPLASAQINYDHLQIELIEPDGMPAMVRIAWPNAPTIVDPKRFPDVRRRGEPRAVRGLERHFAAGRL
jgi:hypothetical protein